MVTLIKGKRKLEKWNKEKKNNNMSCLMKGGNNKEKESL